MQWRPPAPGVVPTLGFAVLDWMSTYLAAPDRAAYEPFVPILEQAQFILNLYALDPVTGRRRIRRAVYSRSKGLGKSPMLAAIGAAEALGPVVPDGWDADGQPVGKPWAQVRTPWVQFAATSEDQNRNSWAPLLEMLREGPVVDEYPGLEPLETFVNLPGKGRIEFVTSAATSREGNRPVFCCFDQSETWRPANGGVRLAATMRRNLGKTGGTSVESPNAFVPGERSVAEDSAEYAKLVLEGRTRDSGFLYDHREAPADTDLTDRESLLAGLRVAYGDAAADAGGWVDLDRIVAEIWDPGTDPQDARRFYLNQVTHASDSWLSQPEWAARYNPDRVLGDGDVVCLGFDGSRKRHHATTDATALVGVRVADGHVFEVAVWEEPDGPEADEWQVPTFEVDRTVCEAFDRWQVVGFYADPALWESYIAAWEAKFHDRLTVQASRGNPIEFWTNRTRIVSRAVEQFHTAVIEGEMTHDGSSVLTRHILNARRRVFRDTLTIAKEHRESPRKIDAAYAAVLAWQARLDAVAAGVGTHRKKSRRLAY